MTEAVLVEEEITFIRKKGELSNLLRKVDKITPTALQFLENTMNDVKVDIKTRVACAKELVNINIVTAKLVNHDNLQRTMAQLAQNKRTGKSGNLVLEDETPELDFSTVQEV